MHIYIYMCVYIYIPLHIYMFIHKHMYIQIYTCKVLCFLELCEKISMRSLASDYGTHA